ncbi:uncharacterized protein LOC130743177 isoform X2 [Lotus japonicus]|uniref:uncharacterized protein LOC130743177 isoform X2 n=1 Tax=Lotus japonicus TaxID=34305 RepID=UPI002590E58D|nr:uncharacterized protein LOC130743177 isoform X2 [Lotus japonicus]
MNLFLPAPPELSCFSSPLLPNPPYHSSPSDFLISLLCDCSSVTYSPRFSFFTWLFRRWLSRRPSTITPIHLLINAHTTLTPAPFTQPLAAEIALTMGQSDYLVDVIALVGVSEEKQYLKSSIVTRVIQIELTDDRTQKVEGKQGKCVSNCQIPISYTSLTKSLCCELVLIGSVNIGFYYMAKIAVTPSIVMHSCRICSV